MIRFISSLGCIESSPELEDKVNKAIENFKNAQEDNNDLLIRLLREIPQLSGMKKEFLQTQFENTLKEFSNSNIAQLNHSNGNQITQTINNYAPSASEKPYQINDDKLKQLIIEFLQLAIQPLNNAESEKQFYIVCKIMVCGGELLEEIPNSLETALLLMCMYQLKSKHNLRKNQS